VYIKHALRAQLPPRFSAQPYLFCDHRFVGFTTFDLAHRLLTREETDELKFSKLWQIYQLTTNDVLVLKIVLVLVSVFFQQSLLCYLVLIN